MLAGGAPWDALVQPPGAATFEPPQELAPADNPDAPRTNARMLASSRGEVLVVMNDQSGGTRVLPQGGTSFGPTGPGPGTDQSGDLFSLSIDDAGGAFLAPAICGNGGCFAYRPAGGGFGSHMLRRPPGCKFDCVDQVRVGAGGDGYAAVSEIYALIHRGPPGGRIAVYLWRRARVGRPHVVATTPYVANTYLLGAGNRELADTNGPVVGRNGGVTVGWLECGSQQLGCSVGAALGSDRGWGRSQTLASTPRSPHDGVDGLVGDGDVAVQRCVPFPRCSISVSTGDTHERFDKPRKVTADGQLQLLVGDAIGDQLIAWIASNGSIYAVTRTGPSGGFGPVHRLSAPGVTVSNLAGAFGPRGEAIVTWEEPTVNALIATVYRAGP